MTARTIYQLTDLVTIVMPTPGGFRYRVCLLHDRNAVVADSTRAYDTERACKGALARKLKTLIGSDITATQLAAMHAHGEPTAREAFRLHRREGEGATAIADMLSVSIRDAEALIGAGRALAGE